jgi:glycosyltransferase involved in cell wall biosynthesis
MAGTPLSVALCTYNGGRFLQEQLQSIARQSRLPDELVVCDDRSTDNSIEIVKAFARQAPFPVRLELNPENLGSTKNFEKAIGLCVGQIVALADQDDVWFPEKLEVLDHTLGIHPDAGYAFSDARLVNENGEPLGAGLWDSVRFREPARRNFTKPMMQVALLLHRACATGATMAFRAKLMSIFSPFSQCFVHDNWISLIASCLGWYGVPIPRPLLHYRQHDGQQIGARRMSIRRKIDWARTVGPAEYRRRTQGFVEVKERLLLAGKEGWINLADDLTATHLAVIDDKIRHCRQRALAHSTSGSMRMSRVFSEVMTGRYARFSNSWLSVVEDLCL